MPENQAVVLWKGNAVSLLANRALENASIIQSRFFLPTDVLVSRYGVVAMLVVDSRPEHRYVSYSDVDWVGVKCHEEDYKDDPDFADPVRLAHFVNTERGFSIIRAFALPPQVVNVFEGDKFLGEPMIAKCACDGTFDSPFDEMSSIVDWGVAGQALPLIEAATFAVWGAAHIPDVDRYEWRRFRTWISFHGWFAFAQAIEQGQVSLHRALQNFDSFLQKFAPQMSPYSTSLVRTSGTVPEKR